MSAVGPRNVRCIRAVVILLGSLLTCSDGNAESLCTGDDPAAVLDCLVHAWEGRDIQALEALYAPDFRFGLGRGEAQTEQSREEELGSARRLFANAGVQEIGLELAGTREVLPGSEPDTWIIRAVETQLRIKMSQQTEPFQVTASDQELLVRRVAEPEPHWQIYRWTDPNRN